MILLNSIPKDADIEQWIYDGDEDVKAMNWIYHQTMGETEKGDTLVFASIRHKQENKGYEALFVGLLIDKDDNLKAMIPAIYESVREEESKLIYYNGRIVISDEKEDREWQEEVDMDKVAREFLKI